MEHRRPFELSGGQQQRERQTWIPRRLHPFWISCDSSTARKEPPSFSPPTTPW
jgi:hypothetical protein